MREDFPGVRERLDTYREGRAGLNAHTAICTHHASGWWTIFVAEGEGVESAHVRNLCALRCTGVAAWFAMEHPSLDTQCYLVSANGEFASEAARQALSN